MNIRTLRLTFSLTVACCFYPLLSEGAPTDVVAVAPGLDGVIEVTESMLTAHLAAFPEQELESAVQHIVDTALLAQIARSRGLDEDAFVQERHREALAWVYLKTIFEPSHLPESVPDAEARQVYQTNISRFVHPEVIKADHIVIGQATSKSIEMPKDEALASKARALLTSLEARLKVTPPSSDAAFIAAAQPITKDAQALGLVARGEALGWFALENGQFDRGFDAEFRKQSFPVAVGDFSSVFASPFGWHIVRVSKRRSAKNETYDMVKDQVKLRISEQVRKRELEKLSARLAVQYPSLTDREGILSLLQIEPLIRLDSKRVLPKLEK